MGRTKGWRPLTPSEKQDIIRRYEAGETIRGLAIDYQRGTPAVREILVLAGVTIRNQSVNTPIELRVHDALRFFGIGFTTQQPVVGRYLPDVLINQAPVVIEADGWQHGLPEQKARDDKRDAMFAAAGYRTFRLTGGEINTDAIAAVKRVIDACGLVPDEEPVYDVRTTFVGETHPRWKGGKREYTCDTCGEVFLAQPKWRPGPNYYCSRQCANAAGRGKKLTAEHRAKISSGGRGKKHKPLSAESKAKLGASVSAALKGKPKSPEHVAKVAAALRGRTVSPETRAKISESLKRRNASQIKIESDLTGDRES